MNASAMLEPATRVRRRKGRRAPGLRATLGPFLRPYRVSLLAAAGFSVLQSMAVLRMLITSAWRITTALGERWIMNLP